MKSKLTSVVLSILLHLGLAGALVYAYTQKLEHVEPAQAISVALVAAPQQRAIADPVLEPISKPIKDVAEAVSVPTPSPKKLVDKATPKPVVAEAQAKPKPVAKKKTVTTTNKKSVASKPKKKVSDPEEEKWAELLQPVKASQPKSVTTSRQAFTQSKNTRQSSVAKPLRAGTTPIARKAVSSPKTQHATGNYKSSLRSLIERQKKYPSRAKRRGDEGVVVISFDVFASGQISNVRVKTSSGSRTLDRAAMKTVKRVSGKLPFTAGMQKRQLSFNVPLTYRLR